jgi:phosphohistidine phosphatase SixA
MNRTLHTRPEGPRALTLLVCAALLAGTACAGSATSARETTPSRTRTALIAEAPADAAPAAMDSTSAAVRDSMKAAPAKGRYPVQVPTPPDSVVVELLRRGDFVLLFRHAATDWGQRDADAVDFADRTAQRNLSEIGRAQADSVGRAVRALHLKIGPVLASPMWRCRDTATIAFGKADTTIHLFVKSRASRDVRVKWLSTPITNDSLLVLVSHQDPYLPLFRFQRDQLKEADALLIQPLGSDQWKFMAQLSPADWTRLAARYGRP